MKNLKSWSIIYLNYGICRPVIERYSGFIRPEVNTRAFARPSNFTKCGFETNARSIRHLGGTSDSKRINSSEVLIDIGVNGERFLRFC
jgi:hypothetical protein